MTSQALPGAKDHIEAARAKAAQVDDIPADTPLKPIARVGVLGAGTMGGGIAMNFLTAGITTLPARAAASDEGKPAAPTMAAITMWVSAWEAIIGKAPSPETTSVASFSAARRFLRSSACCGSGTAANRGA